MLQTSRDSRHDRLNMSSIVDSLEQAGMELDELWTDAVSHGSEDSVVLGEASQDVHRALIALTSG